MPGNGLGVIAGGHRDDTARAFAVAEEGKLVGGTAFLEGVGDLKVFVFYENLRSCQRGQPRCGDARCVQHRIRNTVACGFDIRKRDRQLAHYRLAPGPGSPDVFF